MYVQTSNHAFQTSDPPKNGYLLNRCDRCTSFAFILKSFHGYTESYERKPSYLQSTRKLIKQSKWVYVVYPRVPPQKNPLVNHRTAVIILDSWQKARPLTFPSGVPTLHRTVVHTS